ncbi:PucR family transcriptional regulator [Neobacillus sp. NPDC093127]|uniref:PucR family transcriptional regulator n=1 Tax=Neobacillus sp. NPDC093127 TaxID=3364296 RepID=UPI00380EBB62
MFKKLLSIYENSILFLNQPENPSDEFFTLFNDAENEWISIPKTDVSEKELKLLKTIFKLVEVETSANHSTSNGWNQFLLLNGPLPSYPSEEASIRLIQFHMSSDDANQIEMESALKGFFTEDVLIIWENGSRGIVIEEKTQISLSEEELISMSETLESDFYVKISFYIGKLHPFSLELREKFRQEQEYFSFGIINLGNPHILTFERVFPAFLAHHLPEELKQKVNQEVIELFQDDPEMFATVKIFLENNLNASLTAKRLYIHRNTLQYRIDKFCEKTGIGLKDFHGAFTVFLACLLFEQKRS